MIDVVARRATLADRALLSPLISSLRDHLNRREPTTDAIALSLQRLLTDPETEFLLALDAKGEPLGYSQIRFRFSVWVAGTEAQLDDFFVVPAERHSGIGTRILAACIQRARERGVRVLGLNTNERNEDALRLYTRAGFRAERARWSGGRQLWLEVEP